MNIDIITSDKGCIRVQHTEFEGKPYVDIRKFYLDKNKEWCPTKKGLFVEPHCVKDLISALTSIQQVAPNKSVKLDTFIVVKKEGKTNKVVHSANTEDEIFTFEPLKKHYIFKKLKSGKYKLIAAYGKEGREVFWDEEIDNKIIIESSSLDS